MNLELLAELGRNALAYARTYNSLVEAFIHEGLPEPLAREEARHSAAMVLFVEDEDGNCPLCGGSGEAF